MLLRLARVFTMTMIVLNAFSMKAAAAKDTKPRSLGVFSAWTAATFIRNGHRICYTFSPSVNFAPSSHKRRSTLMVTNYQRSSPYVSILDKPAVLDSSSIAITVRQREFAFFISKGVAYARQGEALIQALRDGSSAIVIRSTSKHLTLSDRFSLQGFTAAYAATLKFCPT
jgi:hypothetical protein